LERVDVEPRLQRRRRGFQSDGAGADDRERVAGGQGHEFSDGPLAPAAMDNGAYGTLASPAMLRVAQVALATIIIAFLPPLASAFELPKADVVRIVGIGLLVTVVASPAARRRIHWQPLDAAVAAWLAAEALATTFSRLPAFSLFGDVMLHEGLLTSLG